jgi:hypothetical protein
MGRRLGYISKCAGALLFFPPSGANSGTTVTLSVDLAWNAPAYRAGGLGLPRPPEEGHRPGRFQFTEHIDGATIFAHDCRLSFESIVSSHRQHPYRSNHGSRSRTRRSNEVAAV